MTSSERYDFGDSAVIVARVSTPSQKESPQLSDLRNYAQSLGFKHIEEFGTTESGFLEMDDKQGWNLVVDFFEKNPNYKVLICTELSRLSRVKSTLMLIEEYLIKNKIQLIVKDINFYLFNDYGNVTAGADMIFSLFASFAASEMSEKKERFKRALKEYKSLGLSLGGKELFGYTRTYIKVGNRQKSQSKYVINEKEKQEIIQIYKWYAFGIDNDLRKTSVRTITEKCIEEGMSTYLHSKRNVNKCLKEEAYTGTKITKNKIKNPEYWNYKKLDAPKYIYAESYECLYPPIFDGENAFLFDYVQARMSENNSKKSINSHGIIVSKERKHTTILSKLIICPVCGHFLIGDYRKRNGEARFSYRCNYSKASVNKCSFTSTISMTVLDSFIWEICKGEVKKIRVSETLQQNETKSNEIQSKIANLQMSIDNFGSKFQTEETIYRMRMNTAKNQTQRDTFSAEYEKRINSIQKERKSLQQRQAILKKELSLSEIGKRSDIKQLLIDNVYNKKYTKADISKYVHYIVKSIEVLHTNAKYTVLKINTISYNSGGYLCIFKRRTLFIEALTLYKLKLKPEYAHGDDNCPLTWDKEQSVFRQGRRKITLQQLYNFAFIEGENHTDMTIFTYRIPYNKLDCYNEDI